MPKAAVALGLGPLDACSFVVAGPVAEMVDVLDALHLQRHPESPSRRAAMKQAQDRWEEAWLDQEQARHAYEAVSTRGIRARFYPRPGFGSSKADQQMYRSFWVNKVDALMRMPAPHTRALR